MSKLEPVPQDCERFDFYLRMCPGRTPEVTKKHPALNADERAVRLVMDVPKSVFRTPEMSVRVAFDGHREPVDAEEVRARVQDVLDSGGVVARVEAVDDTLDRESVLERLAVAMARHLSDLGQQENFNFLKRLDPDNHATTTSPAALLKTFRSIEDDCVIRDACLSTSRPANDVLRALALLEER